MRQPLARSGGGVYWTQWSLYGVKNWRDKVREHITHLPQYMTTCIFSLECDRLSFVDISAEKYAPSVSAGAHLSRSFYHQWWYNCASTNLIYRLEPMDLSLVPGYINNIKTWFYEFWWLLSPPACWRVPYFMLNTPFTSTSIMTFMH